jgi:uncharacterized protein (TIGR02246 family)
MLFILALAASMVVLPACQPAGEAPVEEEAAMEEAESETAAVEEGIQQVLEGFTAAWNAGDAAAVAAFYTMDADSSGPDGEMHVGREAIQGRYAELFAGIYQGTTVSISTTSIRWLGPDTIITNGTWEVSGMTVPEGAEMPPSKGLYTNVVVKEGDQLLITSLRSWFPIKAPGTT